MAAIERGWVQGEIEDAAFRYQQEVESGERDDRRRQPVRRRPRRSRSSCSASTRPRSARQLERTARVRAERNAEAAEAALAEVRRVALGDANLLPPMREALRARCTIGEICELLRGEWGMYDSR